MDHHGTWFFNACDLLFHFTFNAVAKIIFEGPNRSLAAHPEVGLNRFSTAVAVGSLMWRKVFFWIFLANDRNDETKDAGAQHHGCAVSSCEELRMLGD